MDKNQLKNNLSRVIKLIDFNCPDKVIENEIFLMCKFLIIEKKEKAIDEQNYELAVEYRDVEKALNNFIISENK